MADDESERAERWAGAQGLLRRFPPPPPTPEMIRRVAAVIRLHAEDVERRERESDG